MISENSIQQLVDRLARLEYIITQSLDTKNKRRNDDVIDEELNIDRYNTNINNDDHNDNDNKDANKDGSNDGESKGTDNSDRKKDNYDEITVDKMEYSNQLQQQEPQQQYHHDDDYINYNKGGIQYYGYDDDYHEDTDVEEDKDDDFDDIFTHHTRNITTTKVTFNHDTSIINALNIDHDEVNDGGDHDGNDEDVGGDAAELDDDNRDDDDDNDFINPLMSMYEQTNHADIKKADDLDDIMVDDQYHNHNELFHPNYTNNSFIHNHIKTPSLSNNNDTNNRRNSDKLMKIIPQSSSSLDTMVIDDTSINDYDAYMQDCISEYNGDDSNIVVGDDDDNDICDFYDDGYDDNNEIDKAENAGHYDVDVFNEVNGDVSDYALRDVIDGYDHYYEDGHDHDDDDDDEHADDDSNVNVRYV